MWRKLLQKIIYIIYYIHTYDILYTEKFLSRTFYMQKYFVQFKVDLFNKDVIKNIDKFWVINN